MATRASCSARQVMAKWAPDSGSAISKTMTLSSSSKSRPLDGGDDDVMNELGELARARGARLSSGNSRPRQWSYHHHSLQRHDSVRQKGRGDDHQHPGRDTP